MPETDTPDTDAMLADMERKYHAMRNEWAGMKGVIVPGPYTREFNNSMYVEFPHLLKLIRDQRAEIDRLSKALDQSHATAVGLKAAVLAEADELDFHDPREDGLRGQAEAFEYIAEKIEQYRTAARAAHPDREEAGHE